MKMHKKPTYQGRNQDMLRNQNQVRIRKKKQQKNWIYQCKTVGNSESGL